MRDNTGMLSFRSVQTRTLIPFCLAVCLPISWLQTLIEFFRDVDEANCLSVDGVSTSFFCCGMSSFQVILSVFTFDYQILIACFWNERERDRAAY